MTRIATIACSLLLLPCFELPAARAQAPAPNPGHPQPRGASAIDLDFPGGPLSEYLVAVRKAYPARKRAYPLNIVIEDENAVGAVEFPALRLEAVDVRTALDAIEYVASTEAYRTEVRDLHKRGEPPVYVVAFHPAKRSSKNEKRLEVFSIRHLVSRRGPGDPSSPAADEMRMGTLLTAIDTGLGMTPGGEPSPQTIRFHEDSGLVFLFGSDEQISAVRTVITALSQGATSSSGGGEQERSGPSHDRYRDLETAHRQLFDQALYGALRESRGEQLARENQELRAEIERLRSEIELLKSEGSRSGAGSSRK